MDYGKTKLEFKILHILVVHFKLIWTTKTMHKDNTFIHLMRVKMISQF